MSQVVSKKRKREEDRAAARQKRPKDARQANALPGPSERRSSLSEQSNPSGLSEEAEEPTLDDSDEAADAQVAPVRLESDPWLRMASLFALQSEQLLPEYHPPAPVLHAIKKRVKLVSDQISLLTAASLASHKAPKQAYLTWCQSRFPALPAATLQAELKQTETLVYVPPHSIQPTGAIALDLVDTAHLRADVLLHLPDFFIKSSDFHQYRYHRRRFAYLSTLAHLIQTAETARSLNISCSFLQESSIKPILVLKTPLLQHSNALHLSIRIHLAISPSTLKLHKLEPFKYHLSATTRDLTSEDPFWMHWLAAEYNRTILDDILSLERTQFVVKALRGHRSYSHALIFLRAWLRARPESNSVGIWLFLLLTAYLHHSGAISPTMLPLEVFRQVMAWWAQSWPKAHLSDTPPHRRAVEVWQRVNGIILSDPSGRTNLAARTSMEIWETLRADCGHTLQCLMHNAQSLQHSRLPVLNTFQALFLSRTSFNYDVVLTIPSAALKRFCPPTEGADASSVCHLAARAVLDRLYRAAGPRVLRFCLLDTPSFSNDMRIGVFVRADQWKRQLDLGPEATDLPAVAAYKEFWGDKAHLRRFKDGRILFCVYWESPEESRHMILLDIVRFALSDDSITMAGSTFDSLLRSIISPQPEQGPVQTSPLISQWAVFDLAWEKLRACIAGITPESTDIPLRIQTVRRLDEGASCTGIRVPQPNPRYSQQPGGFVDDSTIRRASPFVEVSRIIIKFESSGAWPEELPAVERVKTALLLKLGTILATKHSTLVTAVQPNPNFLDVFCGGFVFRLLVFYPREIFMRSSQVSGSFSRCYHLWFQYEERPRLTAAIRALHARYPAYGPTTQLVKRWLSAQMIPLASDGEFPQDHSASAQASSALRPASGDVIPELLVDLLVAHVFSPENHVSFSPPSHYYTGFLRVLELLSRFPFQSQPLVIDWNAELTSEDYEAIQQDFDVFTTQPAGSGLYLAYSSPTGTESARSDDEAAWMQPSSWRRFQPSASIFGTLQPDRTDDPTPSSFLLAKIVSLAQEMVGLLRDHNSSSADILGAFVPTDNAFDVSIALKIEPLSRWSQNVQHILRAAVTLENTAMSHSVREAILSQWSRLRKFYNLEQKSNEKARKYKNLGAAPIIPSAAQALVGFDPTRLLANILRMRLDSLAHILYDDVGGDRIGLVWKKSIAEAHKNLRLSSAINTKPLAAGKHVVIVPNIDQITEEIQSLASDFVAAIQVVKVSAHQL